jgi:hypothetical protein
MPGLEAPIIQPVAQRFTTELSRVLSLTILKLIQLQVLYPTTYFKYVSLVVILPLYFGGYTDSEQFTHF